MTVPLRMFRTGRACTARPTVLAREAATPSSRSKRSIAATTEFSGFTAAPRSGRLLRSGRFRWPVEQSFHRSGGRDKVSRQAGFSATHVGYSLRVPDQGEHLVFLQRRSQGTANVPPVVSSQDHGLNGLCQGAGFLATRGFDSLPGHAAGLLRCLFLGEGEIAPWRRSGIWWALG